MIHLSKKQSPGPLPADAKIITRKDKRLAQWTTLTANENRDLFLAIIYGVVFFSIVVQGLSIYSLTRRSGIGQ
jgi:hypothetical protein